MEQRIVELEKKVQELETALSLIGSQIGQQLDNIIEEYKNGFKEVALKLIDEAKGGTLPPGTMHIGLLESAEILNEINKKLIKEYDGSNPEVLDQIRQNCTLIHALLK
ncbi:hypothetical protein ACE3MS_15270 [Paenibacillus dendritiformis]|uniref:hypothetical protein n=1 Tax=Paenibacillus dendritiformis TaxID=130049 RepID=UPI003647CA67